jgi:hypothetical protein
MNLVVGSRAHFKLMKFNMDENKHKPGGGKDSD